MTNRTNRLLMVGLSHQGAPLSLLERVAVRRDAVPGVLSMLRAAAYAEACVLSTCSRTEIYTAEGASQSNRLLQLLADLAGVSVTTISASAQVITGDAVVAHLFRVTSGLESRVVGEVDIYGQVRSAYRQAHGAGLTGVHLGRLFPAALRCAEQVQSRTGLASQGRSLARRAVDVGLASVPSLRQPRILVIGSGQMAATAVNYLASLGHGCRVAARDEAYAARLAGADLARPLSAIGQELTDTDLLICATSAAQHVVTLEDVRDAMAGRTEPLTLVDLSLPRNVDGVVGDLDNVVLVDLAGLNDAAAHDPALMALVAAGARVVTIQAQRYLDDDAARDAGPLISAVRQRVEETCLEELVRRSPSGVPSAELEQQAHAVAGRLLHRPTLAARAAAAVGDNHRLLLLCEIYEISPEDVGLIDLTSEPGQVRSA